MESMPLSHLVSVIIQGGSFKLWTFPQLKAWLIHPAFLSMYFFTLIECRPEEPRWLTSIYAALILSPHLHTTDSGRKYGRESIYIQVEKGVGKEKNVISGC